MTAFEPNVFTNERFRERKAQLDESAALKNGGGGGTSGGMDSDRISKLEGSIDGLRSNQTLLMTAIGLVSAILIGLASYTVIQIGAVNSRIGDLPGKISGDLRDLSGAISQAVTASKQTSPQVIIMPAPQIAPAQPTPPGPAKQ